MTSTALFRPLLLGVATGLRSQLGLAVLAWSEPAGPGDPRVLRGLRSRPGRLAVGAAAAGELVMDKLPQTPSRLAVGGALGAAGAAAGSYAGAAYRTALPARTRTPDLPWALGEDAVAASLAGTAVRVWPQSRSWRQRLPFIRR